MLSEGLASWVETRFRERQERTDERMFLLAAMHSRRELAMEELADPQLFRTLRDEAIKYAAGEALIAALVRLYGDEALPRMLQAFADHGRRRLVGPRRRQRLREVGRLSVYLARVIGRVVATQQYPGLTGVGLQWIQPLDETGRDAGDALVATAVISSGPGDVVHFIDGREAALACPETFVPVDAAIIGFVEQAVAFGKDITDAALEARR